MKLLGYLSPISAVMLVRAPCLRGIEPLCGKDAESFKNPLARATPRRIVGLAWIEAS